MLPNNFDEWFVRVCRTQRLGRIGELRDERHGDRREDPARDRQQVRREDEIRVAAERGESGGHFLQVAVRVADAVGPIVLRDFTEQQLALGRVAGAAHTARRIRDNSCQRRDEPCRQEGREGEENRRRVAARIGDDVGVTDGFAYAGAQLRHTIDSARRIGPVPRPKVAGQIDDARAGRPRPVDPRQGSAMGQGTEHDGRLVKCRVIGCDERHLVTTEVHGVAALLVRGGERERKARMSRDKRAEFASSVAAGAKNADRYLIHEVMYNHAFSSGQCGIGAV